MSTSSEQNCSLDFSTQLLSKLQSQSRHLLSSISQSNLPIVTLSDSASTLAFDLPLHSFLLCASISFHFWVNFSMWSCCQRNVLRLLVFIRIFIQFTSVPSVISSGKKIDLSFDAFRKHLLVTDLQFLAWIILYALISFIFFCQFLDLLFPLVQYPRWVCKKKIHGSVCNWIHFSWCD